MTAAVTDTGSCYEITSRWGGVRVPKSLGATAAGAILSPVQAVKRRSGTWTTVGNGTNLLTLNDLNSPPGTPYGITGMVATVLENGPLRAKVRLRYSFSRYASGMFGRYGARQSVLTAAVTSTAQTGISVNPTYSGGWPVAADGSDWPLANGTRVLTFNDTGELAQVTGGFGTGTLTVVRGYNGTATGTYASGRPVSVAYYAPAPAAGDGYYECDITVDDGLPLVRFLESSNAQASYSFRFEEGLSADTVLSMSHNCPTENAGGYAVASCVQSVVPSGSFTLTFGGQTTGSLAQAATAAQVQAALEGLSSIGAGNVLVSYDPANTTHYVAFRRSLGDSWQGPITASGATTAYVDAADLYQITIAGSGSDPSGTFTLKYNGVSTGSITFSATAATTAANIQTALAAVTGVASASVLASTDLTPPAHTSVFVAQIVATNPATTHGLTAGTNPTGGTVTVGNKLYGEAVTNFAAYLFRNDLDFSTSTTFKRLKVWDIFGYPLARLFYQAAGATTQDALGFYAGRAGQSYWCDSDSSGGPVPADLAFTSATGPALSCTVSVGRQAPSAYPYLDYSAFEWVLHLAAVDDAQPCNLDAYAGTFAKRVAQAAGFTLTQVSPWQTASPATPPGGWGGTFMTEANFVSVLQKVATGAASPVAGYASYYAYLMVADNNNATAWKALSSADGVTGGLFDGDNYAPLLAAFYARVREVAYQVWQASGPTSLAHGGAYGANNLGFGSLGGWFTARVLLAFPWSPPLPAADVLKIKQAIVNYGYVFLSDDWAPLDAPPGGVGYGTANQAIQMASYRQGYALAFASNSDFAAEAAEAASAAITTYRAGVDADGASIESYAYLDSSLNTTYQNLLQLKQQNTDYFASEARIPLNGKFLLNLVGPPQHRLGGKRMLACFGDGREDNVRIYLAALVATGINGTGAANSALASNLISMWHTLGAPQQGFFGSTVAMIDDTITAVAPTLGSYRQPGYYLCQRYGWGTANESAVFGLWGNTYSDHRHTDYGSLSAWFLQCPLLLDWSSYDAPHTGAAYFHNVIVPEANLTTANLAGGVWNGACQTETPDATGAYTQTQDQFLSFPNSSCMQGTSVNGSTLTWARKVRTLWYNPAYPVLLVEDTLSGSSVNGTNKFICSFNVSATGAVTTPSGSYTPTVNWYNGGNAQGYPAGGTVNTISSAVNEFDFTGPKWQQSATGGNSMSCHAYSLLASGSEDWFLGGWGFSNTGEAAATAYNAASPDNTGAYSEATLNGLTASSVVATNAYREQAHVWRRRSTNSGFKTLFLPYFQNATAPGTATYAAGVVTASPAAGETVKLASSYHAYTNGSFPAAGKVNALATLDTSSQTQNGITISGGECEAAVTGGTPNAATATVHAAVNRTVSLTLPDNGGAVTWTAGTPGAGLAVSGTSPNFTLTYAAATAGGPASVTFTG